MSGVVLDSPRTRTGPIVSRSALAKLGGALALSIPLVLTVDLVSAAVGLLLGLAIILWSGLTPREFFLRTLPIWIAAPSVFITVSLYGVPSGAILFEWGVVRVSEGSLHLAAASALRLFAVGLPSIAMFASIDPTDLADGLIQKLRLSPRFVMGALAAMRLLGLLANDARSLALARRARGVADHGRIRRFFGAAFALFVLAIRRGTTLSTAMEARGFGVPGVRRTHARVAPFDGRDWALIAVCALISGTAVGVAVATGAWNFVFTIAA